MAKSNASSRKSAGKAAARKKKTEPPLYEASHDELIAFYRDMLRIRRFEEKAGQLYGLGLVGGFCHLYIGQEAVVVGFQSALKPGDTVITGYRSHGHVLASGADPKAVMAELTGRAAGISRGKGGSMHMFNPAGGFYGGHGIVGAPVPLGTGLAFAAKYRGSDAVTLAYFGDGAANQGQVYEAFNMAVLWKLPVVYVIENNHYAMGTSIERATGQQELFRRGEGLGLYGRQVDGMNVLAVRAAAEEALAHVRAGKGPILIEAKTYRYRGHSMSDPAKYRPREEVKEMREKHDPIDSLRKKLLAEGVEESALKAIEKEIKAEIEAAADFARNAPEPAPETLYDDVLAEA